MSIISQASSPVLLTAFQYFPTGIMRALETMLQLPTTHLALHSNSQNGYRIVHNHLQNINGLAGDRKGRLFMNHVNAGLSIYNYDDEGKVTLSQHVKIAHGIDNPSYSEETNELILAGFPRVLELGDFAKRPGDLPAASSLTRINLEHIDPKFFGGEGNVVSPPLDEFFLDPSTGVMNMSTTAVVDKQGDAWYMTSAFGQAVVKCRGYSKTY